MLEAETNLSGCVSSVVPSQEPCSMIQKSLQPVARIGLAEGKLPNLTDLDEFNSIPLEEDFEGTGGLI
ncbi:MAG: hypothetical protein IJ083_02840 [Clostridia bacterium]|nr:hypothetical protein [Clostridia bacterium]